MVSLDIDDLKTQNLIVLEAISGSRAYGLDTPQSDTDIRGVFILPEELYYGFEYVEQVCSEKNDTVYYELKKYCQLLAKNNPAAIELLFTPPQTILHKNPLLDRITPQPILSKQCRDTFAGYAMGQVKRAKGLNKKIFNPVGDNPPRAIDFCHILEGAGTVAAEDWLVQRGMQADRCGLTALPHVRDGYALFYADDCADEDARFGGLFRSDRKPDAAHVSQDVCLSSVPKGVAPRAWLVFNQDGFARALREYHEYRQWEQARNAERYQNTLQHGGGYDAKNLMHTFRLLRMALDIARSGQPQVLRPDRDELLAIKSGQFGYDELMERAKADIRAIDARFAACGLPDAPDAAQIERWAVEIRREWYRQR